MRGTLYGALVSQIRSMIQEGELAPGEQIVETGLCETFGVSRTPMREALKVLASEGLVELRPRRTPIVAPVDPDEIAAIFEVMEGLEALAGRRAAENASPADIAELEGMHAAMVAQHDRGDRADYAIRNREIHARVVELAGNPVLKTTYANLSAKIHRARATTNYDAVRWVESVQEHERIMGAFRSGTPRDVADALVDHTRRTGVSVIATLLRVRDRPA
ncbi:GntR family transcriptional regulator [Skermanella stibiiresistens]|nr:GntR family transcriptional regulator [Skermanella stibiiresistens]